MIRVVVGDGAPAQRADTGDRGDILVIRTLRDTGEARGAREGGLDRQRQVTLILNQFDLMLCPGSSPASVDIVPVDPERLLTRSYRFNRSARDEVTQSCQRQFPTLKQHWVGNTLKVTAGLAQHIWLQTLWNQLDFAAPGDTPLPSDSLLSRNFSLRVERSTLGQLVEYFRTNGIRVEIVDADSREARRMLLTDVTLDLRSVPAEQFFSMVFGPYFERVTVEASRVVLQSPK